MEILQTLDTTLVKKSPFKIFLEITKARLAISVVFSTVAGYFLAIPSLEYFNLSTFIFVIIGGYCMVGASNVFNQILEKDIDSKMDRTKSRPLPSELISVNQALFVGVLFTLIGLVLLYNVNPKTAMFGALSIFIYVALYTPMKTMTPLAVFVGAFPGAIPYMLGWVAADGDFGVEAGTLFAIQFLWQFPHFWAIGWFLYDDYKKAGISMLPTDEKDKKTALQIILYTIWTIVISVVPFLGYTGQFKLSIYGFISVLLLGFWFLHYSFQLYKKMTVAAARKLMIVSVIYISLLQIIYVIDKFLY